MELRDEGQECFLLPEDQIIPTAEENWAALKVIMKRVYDAETGTVKPAKTQHNVRAENAKS